jgi:hypothetical protein
MLRFRILAAVLGVLAGVGPASGASGASTTSTNSLTRAATIRTEVDARYPRLRVTEIASTAVIDSVTLFTARPIHGLSRPRTASTSLSARLARPARIPVVPRGAHPPSPPDDLRSNSLSVRFSRQRPTWSSSRCRRRDSSCSCSNVRNSTRIRSARASARPRGDERRRSFATLSTARRCRACSHHSHSNRVQTAGTRSLPCRSRQHVRLRALAPKPVSSHD